MTYMNIRLKKNILLYVFLLTAVWIRAQDSPISLSSRVDKSKITIGDLITYTVTVAYDEGMQIQMPGLGANLGGFEIRDYNEKEPVKKDGRIESSVDYIISTFFTGEFEIPPLTIFYAMPEDSVFNPLTTDPIQILVESVKPSEAGDILDIKDPLEMPRNWWITLRWPIIGAVFLALVLAGILFYRKRKQGKGLLPVKKEPPRPPHEMALEALEKLKASDLLETRQIKQYYIEISEIIRHYIEGRYYIEAMEMTTFEVMQNLSGADISDEDHRLFYAFFDACDLVKFAKVIPSDKKNLAIMDDAFDLVDRTKVIFTESESVENQEDDSIQSENTNGNKQNNHDHKTDDSESRLQPADNENAEM